MKRIFTSLAVCMSAVLALASVEVDGINYNINTSNNTATVIQSEFSGDLVIPESISVDGNEYTVIEIAKYAFQANNNLTSVKIPKTIQKIGAKAFETVNEIKIYIDDLSSWCSIEFGYARSIVGGKYQYEPIAQYRLFVNNVEVSNLEIPSDILYVRVNNFSGCSSISKLTLHDNVTTIGDYAFYKCPNLKTIDFGNNISTIGEYCFCMCSSIEELALPKSLNTLKIGALQSLDKLTKITIPENVETIESGCFINDTNLSTVIFEDSDKDIFIGSGKYNYDPMFKGCPLQNVYLGRNLKEKTISSNIGYSVSPFKNQTGLTSIQIGEGVRILGPYLFDGCSSLTDINTPNSLEEIGSGVFENCTNLPIISNIRYADKCAISVIDKEADNFVLSSDTRLISNYCFSDCKKMKSITLPSNLVFLGDGVFYGCSNLSEIIIPENVKRIGESLFSECENLNEIIIPSNVQLIGSYAFNGCKSIKELVIPESVSGIYDNAFNGCESLAKIKFDDSENSIGLGASGYSYNSLFKDCPLEEVYMGRNIGLYYASGQGHDYLPFYNKNTIKILTIGPEVTNIWNYFFYGCIALENIFALQEQPISLGSNTFSSIYSTCTLNVLPNSIPLYSSANIWKNFINIVGIAPQSIGVDDIGDANGDGTVNAADIVEIVNYIMGSPSREFKMGGADANVDGVVNAADIVLIVNIIMGQ